ncbi:hypothetical protein CYMTET_56284 [Cymbomonas tetramitiformis]|uniref:Uncharacterized protein n=1 Tax=Cymbomonas tetramitiformis TaxID=36881 RepID=A0AAE0ELZ8_9CHLO|nr:hypothetical protein CYMTET_56284 [Cymbomonas tetramitiformis]
MQVVKHAWTRGETLGILDRNMNEHIDSNTSNSVMDGYADSILTKMERIGFDIEKVRYALDKEERNQLTMTYKLLFLEAGKSLCRI